jgi:hypothetical protein
MDKPAVAVGNCLAEAPVMRHLVLVVAAVLGIAVCSPASAQVAGRPWTMPRTADGHPDLQGYWTNDLVTPLERPSEFGTKESLTPDEAAAYAKKRLDQFLAQPRTTFTTTTRSGRVRYSEESHRRTSLLTDPATGSCLR